jgi:integrase/recombinase XerD
MGLGKMISQTHDEYSNPRKTNSALIEKFVKNLELRNYSTETIRGYKSNLKTIARYLERDNLRFTEIDGETLEDIWLYLKEERQVKYKTQKAYFDGLSSFFNYLEYKKIVSNNPVTPFKKFSFVIYKETRDEERRKLISVEDMGMLITSIFSPRDKAIVTVLAKTGVRRNELIQMDISDIDWIEQCIRLKPTKKRSHLSVYFDDETAFVLKRWLRAREGYGVKPGVDALFVGEHGIRLQRHGVSNAVTNNAQSVGLHDPDGRRLEDRFTPHCCRHWFTTHLRRNGMDREFIKELRGDSRNKAIDIYDHIDPQELRKEYQTYIPKLGLY